MRAKRRVRAVVLTGTLALLALLAVACGDREIVGPPAASGHWRLVSIDDAPVAGTQALAADGAVANLDSAEIIFRRYGRMQDIRHLWRQSLLGPPVYFSDSAIVTYLVRGDSIFITRARPVATDTYVDTGVINGPAMEVAVRWIPPGSGAAAFPRWRYVRIGETP